MLWNALECSGGRCRRAIAELAILAVACVRIGVKSIIVVLESFGCLDWRDDLDGFDREEWQVSSDDVVPRGLKILYSGLKRELEGYQRYLKQVMEA